MGDGLEPRQFAESFLNQGKGLIPFKFSPTTLGKPQTADRGKNFANVPSVIAPGQEQAYLDWKAQHDREQAQKAQQAAGKIRKPMSRKRQQITLRELKTTEKKGKRKHSRKTTATVGRIFSSLSGWTASVTSAATSLM